MIDLGTALEGLPPVFTLVDAAGAGLSRHVVARGVRSGEVRRLASGLFVSGATWAEAAQPSDRHLLQARAAACHYARGAVSHHSAAAVHGLPLPGRLPSWVSITCDHAPTTANPRGLARLEPGALPCDQVTTVDGLSVTTVARTLCDCLRTLALPDGVAMLDAAIGRGLVTAEQVVRVRRSQFRWPGATSIDRGLELHDPVRESWLESSALTDLWLLGIPLPECQVSVYSATGVFLGRPDAIWRDKGVALELDGRGKYLSEVDPSATDPGELARVVADAVLGEKRREQGLGSAGLLVERADHTEATRSVEAVATRLRTAFRRHDPTRFTGELRPHRDARITVATPGPPPPFPGDVLRSAPRKGGRRPT